MKLIQKNLKGKSSYRTRWGHERTRTIKGHPKRQARYERAIARGASPVGTPPNPRKE